ncbi:NAD(P)/FAD-dependent oxidoreductase [Rhodoferax ferrireducens]|uniref:NAD(P)/FAD-dependent oxidoreductase n=1 Tax=Rhodoferax ferrireducens TaxID=192843 RepID=UPI000E0D4E29|nr:FAD-dependent oxidoreductase [Rhodoferax ferrireducens]
MSQGLRTVIVGASLAGVTAATTLRAMGDAGEITLVGDEAHAPYSRPPLSKDLLLGKVAPQALMLPPLPADLVLRQGAAVALDRATRTVLLADGERIPYDRLVIASGARARRFVPQGQVREWHVRGLDDALALRQRLLQSGTRVLVIGAGFIGMEVASVCRELGCEVSLLCRREPVVDSLGPFLARRFAQAAQAHGVVLHRIKEPGRPLVTRGRLTGVAWDDGRRLEADVVITAIGCQPNVEWLAGSGLGGPAGVAVDAYCRAAPDIVAAGDVALFSPVPGAAPRRMPFWTHAVEQARAAAATLVQGDAAQPYHCAPYGWTAAFGLAVKLAGMLPPQGTPEVIEGNLDQGLLRWQGPHGSTFAALNHKLPAIKLRRLAA